ncbi:MAG: hypothetical protein IPG04_18925 [Polyangiaceae bacterium]|nr:hypothetical protein [Polyangiaceae bacterium]
MAPGKVAFAVLVALLTRTATARAGDPAAADALFKEALALLDEGKWSEACPKFKASFDFDPSVSTLINLARCSEHDGKLATAWGQLAEAQRLNLDAPAGPRRSQLEAHIKKLSDALSTRLPRVRLVLAGAAPQAEVAMARDGVALPASALGQALPLDPGEHVVSVAAPGYVTAETRFTILEGQSLDVTLEIKRATSEVGPALMPPLEVAPVPEPPARWSRPGPPGNRSLASRSSGSAAHRSSSAGSWVGWLARRPRRSPLAASNRATRARPLKRPRSRTRRATREARS